MLFTEPAFLFLFLPVLLAACFVAGPRRSNELLLLASLVFYASGGGSFLLLMVVSIVMNYLLAVAIDRRRGTPGGARLLTVTVGANLAVLGYFKYANFFVANVNALGHALGWPALVAAHVALPIGISFFTFHAISYVVDVYRGDAVSQKNPVHAALYLLLFPQLIAGPIIRYRDIAHQLAARRVTLQGVAYGVRRFVLGLAKKVLIANVVAGPADRIFDAPAASLTPAVAWLGVICYTLQIYFDFSGYSDMAIGLAALFGFRFPENFRHPYVARSVQDFWRRWHLSLSSWFRDYVYLPLGGNRVSRARTYVNLVTVFFLCGLWHGASWTFVVWGLFHGVFLVAERAGLGRGLQRIPAPLAHAYTLVVVMAGWVFFRADTLAGAARYLAAMAGRAASQPSAYALGFHLDREIAVVIIAAAVCATPARLRFTAWFASPDRLANGPRGLALTADAAATAALVVLFVASVTMIAANTYSPFIYFRF